MMRVAATWGERPEGVNPVAGIDRFREKPRERFLSPEEFARLGQTLTEIEGKGEDPYTVTAVRLLIFTGARLSEILTLKWDEVDFERSRLALADSQTGEKTIPLSGPASEILRAVPRQKGNPHVICGAKPGAHLVNLQKPWRRIRAQAGLHDVRLHDLRHSFASVAAGGGMSLPLIGALLGHSQPQTTARYAHLGDDPRQAAAEEISSRIAAAMGGSDPRAILKHTP